MKTAKQTTLTEMIELIRHTTKSGKQSPFWLVVIDGLESFKVASLGCAKRLIAKFAKSEGQDYEDSRKAEIGRIGDSQTEGKSQSTGENIQERKRFCYPMSGQNDWLGYGKRSFKKHKFKITIRYNQVRKYNWSDTNEKDLQRDSQSNKMESMQPEISHQSFVGNVGEVYDSRTSVGSDSTNRSVGGAYAILDESNAVVDDNNSSIRLRTSQAIENMQSENVQQDKTTLLADRSTITGIFEKIYDSNVKISTVLDEHFTVLDEVIIKPFTKLFYALGGTPEEIDGSSGTRKSNSSFPFPQRNITADVMFD
jgi:hypothetical protein